MYEAGVTQGSPPMNQRPHRMEASRHGLPQIDWSILLLSKRRTRDGYQTSQTRRDCHQTAPGRCAGWAGNGTHGRDTAMAMVQDFAKGPTKSFGRLKRMLQTAFSDPMEAQLEKETQGIASMMATRDGPHGLESFLNKQKPEFEGR